MTDPMRLELVNEPERDSHPDNRLQRGRAALGLDVMDRADINTRTAREVNLDQY